MTVLRDEGGAVRVERGADVRHALLGRDGVNDVGEHGPELGVGRGVRLARDEDRLVGAVGERARFDDLLGALRLAGADRVRVQPLRAEGRADRDGGDDEREPAEDCRLAVTGAPSTEARGEVRAVLERRHCLSPRQVVDDCVQGRAPAPPRPSGMTPNRPRFDPGPSADRSAGVRAICLRPLLTATTTRHPADIPQEDAGSSRPPPPIPASPRLERPALPGDPRLSPPSPEPQPGLRCRCR